MNTAYKTIEIVWNKLKEYLGDDFQENLTNYHTCCDYCDKEFNKLGVESFYKKGKSYLYDLTHFHFSSYKKEFFSVVLNVINEFNLTNIADFGCGIGLDGQALLQKGHKIDFFDFTSPASKFLEWRIMKDLALKVSVNSPYHFIEKKYDLIYAVDVLEHIQQPDKFIEIMFSNSKYICLNLFPHSMGKQNANDMHFPQNHRVVIPKLSSVGELIQVANSGETIVMLYKSKI